MPVLTSVNENVSFIEKLFIEKYICGLIKVDYAKSHLYDKGEIHIEILGTPSGCADLKYEYFKELRDKALKEKYYDSYSEYLKAKREVEAEDIALPSFSKNNNVTKVKTPHRRKRFVKSC